VESLVRAGYAEEQITSLSSVPYPDGVLVKTGRRSWFRWLTLAGGLAGAATGFLLAAGTAALYPVQTGDKPIVAFYPTGIIAFEITMLFAIAGTMAGMFMEMKLPPREKRPYDPAISEGCIGISLTIVSEEQARRAEEIMEKAGAISCTQVCGTPLATVRRRLEGGNIRSESPASDHE
jgi:hypothetical protein